MKIRRKDFFEMVLAGLLMAFAWSLSARFSFFFGPLIPGIFSAVIPALLLKEEHWRESIGKALLLAPIGFWLAGFIKDGSLFDSVSQASAFGTIRDELAQLFGIGAVAGGIGGTFLGFGFSEKPFSRQDGFWLALVLAGVFAARLQPGLEIVGLGTAVIVLQIYNFFVKKSVLLFTLFLTSSIAFAAAFLFSGILLCAGYRGLLGEGAAWWVFRDPILGFTAGFLFWGMIAGLQRFRLRRFPAESVFSWQKIGFSFWLMGVPILAAADTLWLWKKNEIPLGAALLGLLLIPSISGGLFFCFRTMADFFRPKINLMLERSILLSLALWMLQAVLSQAAVFRFRNFWDNVLTLLIILYSVIFWAVRVQTRKLQRP